MSISATEISDLIKKKIEDLHLDTEARTEGTVVSLTDGIARVAPSFNTQRFPIADGTAFIRPVTLRNLSPDHDTVNNLRFVTERRFR